MLYEVYKLRRLGMDAMHLKMIPVCLCQVNVQNGMTVIHHTAAVGASPSLQVLFTDSVRVWFNRQFRRWSFRSLFSFNVVYISQHLRRLINNTNHIMAFITCHGFMPRYFCFGFFGISYQLQFCCCLNNFK